MLLYASDRWWFWFTVNFYISDFNNSFSTSEGPPSYQVHRLILLCYHNMLSCGTSVSATTCITRQMIQLTETFPAGVLSSQMSSPKQKSLCNITNSCAWTLQLWYHSSELQCRDHFSQQDIRDKLTATDWTALIWQQIQCKTLQNAHANWQQSKQQQTEYWNTGIPTVTISRLSETSQTLSKPNILHQGHNDRTISSVYQFHTQIILVSSTNTCILRAKLKCTHSQHQSKTRVF